jgi:DNA-binding XRE family transcriptional regulator
MDKAKMKELKELIAVSRKYGGESARTPEGRALESRMEFARNLIGLLKSRKTNQAEFCRTIGMKPAQFNRIVQADENVTIATATRIADGFGVHISRLYQKPRKARELVEA